MDSFGDFAFIIALLVISFIRWIFTKLQGKGFYKEEHHPEEPSHPEKEEKSSFHDFIETHTQDLFPQDPQPVLPPQPQVTLIEEIPPLPPEREEQLKPLPQFGREEKSIGEILQKRKKNLTFSSEQFRRFLRSPATLKQAILLKEILDKPKGLQSHSEIHPSPF